MYRTCGRWLNFWVYIYWVSVWVHGHLQMHYVAYCVWSVIQSQSPISISLVSFQRHVACETKRTRTTIENWEWRNDTPNAIGYTCGRWRNFWVSSESVYSATYFSIACIFSDFFCVCVRVVCVQECWLNSFLINSSEKYWKRKTPRSDD